MSITDDINRDIFQSGSRAGQKVIAFVFKGLIKTKPELNEKAANAIKAYNNSLSSTETKNTLADLSNDINGKYMLDIKGKIKDFDKHAKEFGVDYAAFYNQKTDKTYLLFHSKDMERINKAFSSYKDNLNSRISSIHKRIAEIEAAQVAAPASAAAKGIGKAAEAGAKIVKQAINHTEHTR